MRVLLYCINYAPELTGIGKYAAEMAEWLGAHGASVTVVTAPPYYPAWRIDPRYSGWRYRRENIAGVEVIRCPLWVPRRANGLKRIMHLISFAVTSLPIVLWLALRARPRMVFVVEPPLFAAPGALLAARMAGARAWLHVQDFEIDAAFELGMLRSNLLRRLVQMLEGWLMRRFDRVSTISPRMLQRLRTKGIAPEKTTLFPNWVELDRIRPLPYSAHLRAQRFGDVQTIILYSGNMGRKQGLEIVIEAAKILLDRGDNALFLLCGDGVAKPELEQSASGLKNVVFWPLVPLRRLNVMLNLADIHVLPQRADTEDLVLPSKLTNMLASGRPVVATVTPDSQIAELLDSCGVVVPPGDPMRLADALSELVHDPKRRQALGVIARRVAERLWDKQAVLAAAFQGTLDLHVSAQAETAAPIAVEQRKTGTMN